MLFCKSISIDIYVLMCKCSKKRLKFRGDRPVEKLVSQKTPLPNLYTVFWAKLQNNYQTFGSSHADILQGKPQPGSFLWGWFPTLTPHWPQPPFMEHPELSSQAHPMSRCWPGWRPQDYVRPQLLPQPSDWRGNHSLLETLQCESFFTTFEHHRKIKHWQMQYFGREKSRSTPK